MGAQALKKMALVIARHLPDEDWSKDLAGRLGYTYAPHATWPRRAGMPLPAAAATMRRCSRMLAQDTSLLALVMNE